MFILQKKGQFFLIVVDAFSKWLEVKVVPGLSASATIKVLRELFATHDLPKVVVSDSGPAFLSEEFKQQNNNNIRQALMASYHPGS